MSATINYSYHGFDEEGNADYTLDGWVQWNGEIVTIPHGLWLNPGNTMPFYTVIYNVFSLTDSKFHDIALNSSTGLWEANTYSASGVPSARSTWTWSESDDIILSQYMISDGLVIYSSQLFTPPKKYSEIADSVSITGVTNHYLATSASSGVTKNTQGWTTTVQTMTATNQYLWNYETITGSNGQTISETDPIIIGRYGQDGQSGGTGRGIVSIIEHYQTSSSSSNPPSTWSDTMVVTDPVKKYLWNYETINYTSGSPEDTTKRIIGVHGATGDTGLTGDKGDTGDTGKGISSITEYYAINNSTSAPADSSFSTTVKTPTTSNRYLWNYELITYTDSSTKKLDKHIVAVYGNTGQTGDTGNDGVGIVSIDEYYAVSTTTTAPADSSFDTTVKTVNAVDKYLWNYELTTYTDSSTSKSSKHIIGAYGDTGDTGQTGDKGDTGDTGRTGDKGDTGDTGDHGLNSATITLYQRSTNAPSKPSGNVYYTFATGGVTGSTGNWSKTIPSGTNPVWAIVATASSTSATDTIGSGEWSTQTKIIENGQSGAAGATGYNQATIYLYQRASSAPSKPTATNIKYTFATGNLTNIPTGWYRNIPPNNGLPCYVTSAAAISQDTDYTFLSTAWSDVVKLVEDGEKGETGDTGRTGDKGDTGDTGISITQVINYYLATSASSGVTPSTSGWTTAIQTMDATKRYLWNYEVIKGTGNVTLNTSTPTIIGHYGEDGATGATGRGISSITEYYAKSSSSITAPTTGWTGVPVTTTSTEKYLWNYETVTYTDGTTEDSTKRVIGTHGETGAKGDTGTSGLNSAAVMLYQRGTSAPSKPSGNVYYTFATGGVTGATGNWSNTIPSGTNPVWAIAATASSTSATDTISSGEWSSQIKIIENGATGSTGDSGSNGLNQATIYLYQRATTAPNKPTASNMVYTFATGNLTNIPTGWYRNIPADNGNPCFVTTAVAIDTATTYTLPSGAWSEVVKLVADGAKGDTGDTGLDANIWTSTADAVAPNYTFDISALTGGTGEPRVGDIILRSYYRYTITSVGSTTVLAGSRTSLRGAAGAAAYSYELIVSHAAITKSEAGVYNPTSIVLTATRGQGTTTAPASYSGRFQIETTTNNSTWNVEYTSSSDESSKTYTIPDDIIAIRCSLYLAGGTTTLLDQQTVPIVNDGVKGDTGTTGAAGKDAYTIILSNESHTFAAGTDAAIAGTATSKVISYKGATQILCYAGSSSSATSISTGTTGLTCAITNNNSQNVTLTFSATTSLITKSGTVSIPVVADGKSFTKIFTWSLSLTGSTGDTGDTGARGTTWYSGIAIDGQSTTPTSYATGIADAIVGDHYLNTNNQNVFICTTGGNASTAKWRYEQNIKGEQGTTGASGSDGINSYFHVKYSDDGGEHFTGNTGEDPGDWIGTYTDHTQSDSTNVNSYTWAKIRGENATALSDMIPYYLATNRATGVTTSDPGWTREVQTITAENKYLWVYYVNRYGEGETEPELITVSGSIASFQYEGDQSPVDSVVVKIEPTQESGTPSPQTPLSIGGWTGANLVTAGKNLLDNTIKYASSATSVRLGNQNDYATFLKAGTYMLSVEFLNNAHYGAYIREKNDSSATTIWSSTGSTTYHTITIAKDGWYMLWVYHGSGVSADNIGNFQLEIGDEKTTFESYSGDTNELDWEDDAGTVYGGTIDLVGGKLSDGKLKLTVGDSIKASSVNLGFLEGTNANRIGFPIKNTILPVTDIPLQTIISEGELCNIGVISTSASGSTGDSFVENAWQLYRGTNNWFFRFCVPKSITTAQDAYAWLQANGCEFTAPNFNPVEYDLTPQQITLLQGQNNIWADTGDVTVGYYNGQTVGIPYITGTYGETGETGPGAEFISGTQAASTRFWTGTSSSISELTDGLQITYWLPYASKSETAQSKGISAAELNPTETVTSASSNTWLKLTLADGTTTAWVPCYYGGTTRLTTHYGANNSIRLTYKANIVSGVPGGWWADANYYSDTSYTRHSNYVVAGANGIRGYSLVMKDSQDTWSCFYQDAYESTGTTKTVYQGGFILGPILYITGAGAQTTNSSLDTYYNYKPGVNAGTPYDSYALDLRYSTNCGKTLTNNKAVYLVGTINSSNGLFYLDNHWYTQTIPSTEDGKIYVYIGDSYSTYQVYLNVENTPYQFYKGEFRKYSEVLRLQNEEVANEAYNKSVENEENLANELVNISNQITSSITNFSNDLDQNEILARLTGTESGSTGSTKGLFVDPDSGELFINANYIHSGTLTLGGLDNVNGRMVMYDENGSNIGTWDSTGLKTDWFNFDNTSQTAIIGKDNFHIGLNDQELGFYEGNTKVAFVNNNSLHINQSVVLDEVQIGDNKWAWINDDSDNSINLKWIGSDNLLTYPYYSTTFTKYGYTVTDNGDGSITMNGTKSVSNYDEYFQFRSRYDGFVLPPGTYEINQPEGATGQIGTTGSYFMRVSAYKVVSGSQVSVTHLNTRPVTSITISELLDYNVLGCDVVVQKGAVLNNITFEPIINIV